MKPHVLMTGATGLVGSSLLERALEACPTEFVLLHDGCLDDAEDRLDSTSGLLARIGAWGSDLEADVDAARTLLEAGDTDAALAVLDSVGGGIDDLTLSGLRRLAIAGTALAAAMVLGELGDDDAIEADGPGVAREFANHIDTLPLRCSSSVRRGLENNALHHWLEEFAVLADRHAPHVGWRAIEVKDVL